MELSGYFAVARRWWWTLLVAAWVAGLAGFYVASRIAADLRVAGQAAGRADQHRRRHAAGVRPAGPDLRPARDDADRSSSRRSRELGLTDRSRPSVLAANTRVTANDVTRVLTIRVQDGESERAADLANGMADHDDPDLEERGQPSGGRPVLSSRRRCRTRTRWRPQVSLIVLLATAAGILAAIVLVLLIEYLSRSIRTREELARLAGAPVLGSVPAPAGGTPTRSDLVDEASSAATVYRVLAARIVYGDPSEILHSVAVVDAESETGVGGRRDQPRPGPGPARAAGRRHRRREPRRAWPRCTGSSRLPGIRDILEPRGPAAVGDADDRRAARAHPGRLRGRRPDRPRAGRGRRPRAPRLRPTWSSSRRHPSRPVPAALSWARAVDGPSSSPAATTPDARTSRPPPRPSSTSAAASSGRSSPSARRRWPGCSVAVARARRGRVSPSAPMASPMATPMVEPVATATPTPGPGPRPARPRPSGGGPSPTTPVVGSARRSSGRVRRPTPVEPPRCRSRTGDAATSPGRSVPTSPWAGRSCRPPAPEPASIGSRSAIGQAAFESIDGVAERPDRPRPEATRGCASWSRAEPATSGRRPSGCWPPGVTSRSCSTRSSAAIGPRVEAAPLVVGSVADGGLVEATIREHGDRGA